MKSSECNLDKTLNVKKFYHSKSSDESNSNRDIKAISEEKKYFITGDSILNGIHRKGLSKNHHLKVNNFPGCTSETILWNIDDVCPCRGK